MPCQPIRKAPGLPVRSILSSTSSRCFVIACFFGMLSSQRQRRKGNKANASEVSRVRSSRLFFFRQDSALLLGDLPPTMQPFLYRLAHAGTLAWASKYGFQAMQDLVHCPSNVRTLVSFTVPANPNLPPSLSKLTSKAELSSVSSPKSRATSGSQVSLAIRCQILLSMLGNAITTTPDKSPQR